MIIRFKLLFALFLLITITLCAQSNNLLFTQPTTEFYKFLYGNSYNDRLISEFNIPVISKDSLNYIQTLNFNNNNSIFIYKSLNNNLYKFIPLSLSLNEITPKLLYKTISDKTKESLIKGQNLYSAVLSNKLLQKFYPYLCNLRLSEIATVKNSDKDNLVGFWGLYNKTEEIYLKDTLNTNGLIYLLNNNPSVKIKFEEVLQYRLLDILLGNINVHPNNYWFVKYNNTVTPFVFPKQSAFPIFGGLFYIGGRLLVPSFISFGENYKSPEATTWKSRYFDRRFLTHLNWEEWKEVVNYIKINLPDSLIRTAIYNKDIQLNNDTKLFLTKSIITRKNELDNFAYSYFKLLNKYAEIYCTSQIDSVLINRNNNKTTTVTVKSAYQNSFVNYFERTFNNNETKEIRVFLGEGDDFCKITGNVDSSPIIIVNGEEGKDKLIDLSYVDGYLFSILPIKQSDYNTYFFDADEETEIIESDGTVSNYAFFKNYVTYNDKYDTELKDYGHDWSFYPILELNTDEGLITGGGPELTKFNYGLLPYSYFMRLTGSYATQPKSYKVAFNGIFNNVVLNSSILVNISKSELSFDKYFGYGNETEYNYDKEKAGYYKSFYELVIFSFGIKKEITKNIFTQFSMNYEYSDFNLSNITLLNDFKFDKYGLGSLWLFSGEFSAIYDSRDVIENPHKGIFTQLKVIHYPTIFEKLEFPFTRLDFDFRIFNKINGKYSTVIANRLGGSAVIGKYPFLKGAFIGGKESLRGYNRNRFAGDASLFSQNEIRTQLTNLDIFVKSKIGLLIFSDIGRVFVSNKNSKKWHPTAGFGTWVDFSDRLFTVVATLAFSNEKPEIFFGTNFSF